MLSLCFWAFLVIGGIGIVLYNIFDWEITGPIGIICLIIALILLIPLTVVRGNIETSYTIDEKIALYEEENAKIEGVVKTVIDEYIGYEGGTYSELVDETDLETLLIKYPELNSYQLIRENIELLIQNNREILSLKEKKINIAKQKWWYNFSDKD